MSGKERQVNGINAAIAPRFRSFALVGPFRKP
jgi:hypothetical protein